MFIHRKDDVGTSPTCVPIAFKNRSCSNQVLFILPALNTHRIPKMLLSVMLMVLHNMFYNINYFVKLT